MNMAIIGGMFLVNVDIDSWIKIVNKFILLRIHNGRRISLCGPLINQLRSDCL